ncbi:hypothetical protein MMC31_005774, partial [Peltigera leucophlebia]|nr:hypothetical protein [Peltigera leucophlebia]
MDSTSTNGPGSDAAAPFEMISWNDNHCNPRFSKLFGRPGADEWHLEDLLETDPYVRVHPGQFFEFEFGPKGRVPDLTVKDIRRWEIAAGELNKSKIQKIAGSHNEP